MMTLEGIKSRARLILNDAEANRFSDEQLENAVRMTLQTMDERLPQILSTLLEVTLSGRDLALTGMENCLYLVQLALSSPAAESSEEEIKSEYTYTLQSGTVCLHFSGTYIPQTGQTLKMRYAARNTLNGLDGAESSTLPESAEVALEFGTAGYACLLRAAAVSEAYGARPGESTRLAEQSRLWLEQLSQAVNGLKNLQEFGYPIGFALDQWDRKG